MTTFLVVNVVALWLLVVVQGLVLLEMVRQVSQVRKQLDLDDRPIPFTMGELAGRPLPDPARALWAENGAARDGVLVFLSTDCATCWLVASGLRDVVNRFEHAKVVAVLQARDHDEAARMLGKVGLAEDEVVVDLEGAYAMALGIEARPAAVVVREGIVSEGAAARNPRQLQQVLEGLESSTRKEVRATESSVVSNST